MTDSTARGRANFVDSFSRYNQNSPGQRPGAPRTYRNGTHAPNGRDFGMPLNTPLVAEMDWRLVASPRTRDGGRSSNSDQHGKWFSVEYADGSVHIFRHTNTLPTASSGRAGEVMALSGNTGVQRSNPHTHRESWARGDGRLVPTDPAAWISSARTGRPIQAGSTAAASARPAAVIPEAVDLSGLSTDQINNMRPDSISRGGNAPQRPLPARTPEERRALRSEANLGRPGGAARPPALDATPDMAAEVEAERVDVAHHAWDQTQGFFDRFTAAAEETWTVRALAAVMRGERPAADPNFVADYMNHWEDFEEGYSDDERSQLRTATSAVDLANIQRRVQGDRVRNDIINSNGTGGAFRLTLGLVDPMPWLASAGVGNLLRVGGIGGRALLGQGRVAAGVTSLAAEGAVGNTLALGILDASGEHVTGEEYGWNAALGLAIGAATTPIVGRGAARDLHLESEAEAMRVAREAYDASLDIRATASLGADATPEALAAERTRLGDEDHTTVIRQSLADVPDHLRVMPVSEAVDHAAAAVPTEAPAFVPAPAGAAPGTTSSPAPAAAPDPRAGWLTNDPAVLSDVSTRHNLEAMHDSTERAMAAEQIARLERVDATNPVDQAAARTILRHVGGESTASTLHTSPSAAARGFATIALESPTGAATRHPTAAIVQAIRERVYMRDMAQYESHFNWFARDRDGGGLWDNMTEGRVRNEFDRRVFDEVEARRGQPTGDSFDAHPAVRQGADAWEQGMNRMRIEQQHVGTVGHLRLGDTSRGYMTHRLDPRKVAELSPGQQRNVRAEISRQVQAEYTWDTKFANRFAKKYLERAERKVTGSYDVPVNLWSPDSADVVRDALQAMQLPAKEIESRMGKISRGGANHTKSRINLDMQRPIGDGMILRDLYNTDIVGMYRGYARRVSGDVALAQFGIMGRNGLKTVRTAIEATLDKADPQTIKTMRAFDQTAAELLNQPFGGWNHRNMDRVRVATSVARLGGMAFTQAGELGNGIVALGIHRVLASTTAMPRLLAEVRALAKGGNVDDSILKSIDLQVGGIGMDGYHLTRAFDVPDNGIQMYSGEQLTIVDRGLRGAAHLQASLSLHRMITAGQTRGMAEQIIHKAMKFIRSGADDVHLNDMGIDAELRTALKGDLSNIATFDAKGNLTALNLEASTLPPYQIKKLITSIERGASQIIQRTYIGETGAWAHNGFLKLLTQFRTFPIVAMEKQWGRAMRVNGGTANIKMAAIKSVGGLAVAMGFAMPIHYARVYSNSLGMSSAEREKYIDDNTNIAAMTRATINYASDAGLLSDILDVGSGFASNFGTGGESFMEAIGTRGAGRGKSALDIVPGVGALNDLWTGLHGLDSARGREKLLRLLPGSSLPFVRPIINAATAE